MNTVYVHAHLFISMYIYYIKIYALCLADEFCNFTQKLESGLLCTGSFECQFCSHLEYRRQLCVCFNSNNRMLLCDQNCAI